MYVVYIYIRTHFQSAKFFWNINANYRNIPFETFLKRKDCKLFAALRMKYPGRENVCNYIISSFLYDNRCHISDMYFSDEIKTYLRPKKEDQLKTKKLSPNNSCPSCSELEGMPIHTYFIGSTGCW